MPSWFTAPLATVIGSALTALIGLVVSRFTRNNAPDIVSNDLAKKLQAEKDRLASDAQRALETGDLAQVRKDDAN